MHLRRILVEHATRSAAAERPLTTVQALRGTLLKATAATAGVVLVAALIAVAPAQAATPVQRGQSVRAAENAARLIREGRLQEAVQTLDRALADDEEYWEAHYQRGRALGQLGRWPDALAALLEAAELNPGHGHAHRLASLAAANVNDWDTAWDQAIKAQLAGEDMTQTLLGMYEQSAPPDDFAVRIQAVTIFVADIDTSSALADVNLPTNINPNAATGTGQRQGRGANLEDSAINQSAPDLIRLQRAMRSTLAGSPRLAVTVNPGQAKFVLAISLTDIATSEPRAASGYFRVLDVNNREVVYRAPIDFPDIANTTVITGKLRRYVTDLEAWLAEREG